MQIDYSTPLIIISDHELKQVIDGISEIQTFDQFNSNGKKLIIYDTRLNCIVIEKNEPEH